MGITTKIEEAQNLYPFVLTEEQEDLRREISHTDLALSCDVAYLADELVALGNSEESFRCVLYKNEIARWSGVPKIYLSLT